MEDLSLMKPTALFVNTSRAELVAENALVSALNRGRPGMAAVDVFESEPILQGHPLLRLENAVCTPHIGYVEQDSYELYFGAAFDNVISFINQNPSNIINPEALEGAVSCVERSALGAAAGQLRIGCGVMVTSGALNDLCASLQVSVALGGQLITVGAMVMGLGAPLLAAAVAGWDRRRLLTLSLLWYALGHLVSAAAPSYAWLLPLRAVSVIGAAVFTPQAAAAINVMDRTGAARARHHLRLPGLVAGVGAGHAAAQLHRRDLGLALGLCAGGRDEPGRRRRVWRSVPDGVKPPALSRASWRHVLTHPLLMGVVAITAVSAAGQFTLTAYLAPYYRQVLQASPAAISALFFSFGAFGVIGNVLLTRWVDRLGAAHCTTLALAAMALSMLIWPLASTPLQMALVGLPWGLGCFSSNSAQQARLGHAAPALAPALMALNSSAIYLGQAVGAASGGALIATQGLGALHGYGAAWLLAAVALSAWLAARMKGPGHG
jgi:DHA1 family inner membrane transport protein